MTHGCGNPHTERIQGFINYLPRLELELFRNYGTVFCRKENTAGNSPMTL
jgi:hypothetical protein